MSLKTPHCPVCKSKEKLLRCQACKVMPYCGKEHQVIDRRHHKNKCNSVKKSQKLLDDEERKLRAIPPGQFMIPPNIFEEGAGHFWSILVTRPYMRARLILVEELLKIKTFDAVQAALNHVMDILRLCRSDNMGVRLKAPALFLRLGKDQECYDFLKWYATTAEEPNYDWGNMSLSFLDVKNANAFETVDFFIGNYADLSHAIAITLIKIRLLQDLRSLQNSSFLGERVPIEMVNKIQKELVSTIVSQNKDIMYSADRDPIIKTLELQLEQMYAFVKESNKYFWPALLKPAAYLAARPDSWSDGSVEHAQLTLQNFYDAWFETPGSIDMIKDLIQNDNDAE